MDIPHKNINRNYPPKQHFVAEIIHNKRFVSYIPSPLKGGVACEEGRQPLIIINSPSLPKGGG